MLPCHLSKTKLRRFVSKTARGQGLVVIAFLFLPIYSEATPKDDEVPIIYINMFRQKCNNAALWASKHVQIIKCLEVSYKVTENLHQVSL